MKKRYEKPIITKLETGFMNKFGSSPLYARKIRKDIDGIPIDEKNTDRFITPLHPDIQMFSLDGLTKQIIFRRYALFSTRKVHWQRLFLHLSMKRHEILA